MLVRAASVAAPDEDQQGTESAASVRRRWYAGRVRRAWFAIVACGACYSPTIASDVPCESECPEPQVCVDHVCRAPDYMPPDAPVDVSSGDSLADSDGDDVPDFVDDCPALANPNQHDEDADTIGDVCDPCPHLAGTALDSDADGVGDACDPQPTIAKQRLTFFDPFTSALPPWDPTSGLAVVGDQMRISGSAATRLALTNGELRIITAGTITAVGAQTPHQLVIAFGFNSGGANFHYCETYDTGGTSGGIKITEAASGTYTGRDSTSYIGVLPIGAWSMQIDESVAAQRIDLGARLGGMAYPALSASTSAAPVLTTGSYLVVSAENMDISFDYFVAIETLP